MIPGHATHTAPIGMTSRRDSWPTHEAIWGKGGHRSVATMAERDQIPSARREQGMTCWVLENQTKYRLSEDLTTWEIDCCRDCEYSVLANDIPWLANIDGTPLGNRCVEVKYVRISGDTMTGPLILSERPDPIGDPLAVPPIPPDPPLQAAPYQWVLDQIALIRFAPIIIDQAIPVSELVYPHTLGRPPIVQVMDSTGRKMINEVIPTSVDVTFRFEGNHSFTAILI